MNCIRINTLRILPFLLLTASAGFADTITLVSGETVDGTIGWMENSQVGIDIDDTQRVIDLSDVLNIDFNTPHLIEGTPSQPLEHFTGTLEAQEMLRLGEQLEDVRYELHILLGEIEGRWQRRDSVPPEGVSAWEADKERFQAPLADYQEILREIYLHVLGHVDDYNLMAEEAHDLYIGVEGIFRVGSPLIPDDETELPLRDFLPRHLVDRLYYEGYVDGANVTRQLIELDQQSPNNIPQQQTDDEF